MEVACIVLNYQAFRVNFFGSVIISKIPKEIKSLTSESLLEWAKKEIVDFHNKNYKSLISQEDLTFVDIQIKFGVWSMITKSGGK